MKVQKQIDQYISSLPDSKGRDMRAIHEHFLSILPGATLWFLDGKNEEGKIVSNPSIGYGKYTIQYANGQSRAFYQIGLSANSTGISVYVMGLNDKHYLSTHFGDTIGKAAVSGYCIKFKKLSDINIDVLSNAVRSGLSQTTE